VHPSTLERCGPYSAERDRLCPSRRAPSLFVSSRGTRLCHETVQPTFRQLVREAGLERPWGSPQPRVHGFRHSFAVDTLLGWYRDSGDVAARMPLLSTYLGHVDIAATYWYLSAVPELLALARSVSNRRGGRSMRRHRPSVQGFFTERLVNQKRVSAHTITAYRDTFRLLLTFASKRSGKSPSELDFDDLDATVIGAFLDLPRSRTGNSARTRNLALAAIHSHVPPRHSGTRAR